MKLQSVLFIFVIVMSLISCSGKGKFPVADVVDTDSVPMASISENHVNEKPTDSEQDTSHKLSVASAFCYDQLGNQAGNNYSPDNMTDGNPATAWAVSLSAIDDIYGNGIVVGPVFKLASPASAISGVELQNGYCKNSDSFKNNTRASWVTIYRYHPEYDGEYAEGQNAGFIDEKDIIYDGPLADNRKMQYFTARRQFDNSRPTCAIGLLFTDGRYYYGEKWNDLCLSEINIFGR